MALNILLFCALVFASQGVYSLSNSNLVETVVNLQKQLKLLSNVVDRLEAENDALKTRVDTLEKLQVRIAGEQFHNRTYNAVEVDAAVPEKFVKHIASDLKSSKNKNENESSEGSFYESQNTGEFSAVRKRIVPPTSTPTGVIAFHSYLSKDSDGPLSLHHILKFDVVPLNKGNGYNVFDGIFIVPVAGTYVFTWSFMSEANGVVYTELMKNSDIIGTRYADSATSTVWDFATGVVVVDVSQRDHIYIRMGMTSHGKVLSITKSRTTFSGWRLD